MIKVCKHLWWQGEANQNLTDAAVQVQGELGEEGAEAQLAREEADGPDGRYNYEFRLPRWGALLRVQN